MQVEDNRVVLFHYSLMNSDGDVVDSSRDGEPLPYLHGHQNIVPGLELAMAGHEPGDSFNVLVEPEQGYGLRDEAKVQVVDRESFAGFSELETGMLCQMENAAGEPEYVTVVAIDEDEVTVDANHPFAGQVLNFTVEVIDVREASADELAAGRIDPQGS